MAYWIQGIGGSGKNNSYRLYFCDAESDVSDLPTLLNYGKKQENSSMAHFPCDTGSKAFVVDTGNRYVLTSADEWKNLPVTSSGGSSGGGEEPGTGDYVDKEDIDSLFPKTNS